MVILFIVLMLSNLASADRVPFEGVQNNIRPIPVEDDTHLPTPMPTAEGTTDSPISG